MTPSVRQHQLLLVLALAVPALLFLGVAWQNHADVLRDGNDAILRTVAVMQEHARKVFETAELAIGQVDERIDDQDERTILAKPTSDFLYRLKASMDHVLSIWVTNQDGLIQAGSQPWPEGSTFADRAFFAAQRLSEQGTIIGAAVTGRVNMRPTFVIMRRRSTPDHQFAGTIHVAASPDYFSRFYAEIAPRFPHQGLLLRQDGSILARDPPGPVVGQQAGAWLTPALASALAAPDEAGRVFSGTDAEGVVMDHAVRRVGAHPVFVLFSVPHQVLLGRWHRNLVIYGAVAASTALTLLTVSWLALRRAVAEQRALSQMRAEIIQRQAAEAQLRHAQRMDAVGQLTGGVAHDFNNLLTAILGSLELIQRAGTRPDAAERITRLTATAIGAVQRGSALTKGLLAFSRKQPLQPVALDANTLVEELLDLIRQAVGVGIAVRFEPSPGLPPCLADPAELQGALLNLAINARDAMPDGGHLLILAGTATLSAEALSGNTEARPGRFVTIAVTDTGSGMCAEVAAKAFEPFFTTKPIGQGTGLGLSQVFGFVRQLGGHVTIDSAPATGTRITLFLPVLNRPAA